MCTLVILRRPEHRWPVLIGANRDEMIDRPSQPPGRHWPDRAEVVAGLDLLAGGSWLGLNDWGVAAAVLNRQGSLGPATGLRRRGARRSRPRGLSQLQPDRRRQPRRVLAAPRRHRPDRDAAARRGPLADR